MVDSWLSRDIVSTASLAAFAKLRPFIKVSNLQVMVLLWQKNRGAKLV